MRIENQWADNQLTAEGSALHEVAHNSSFKESRGDKYIIRGLRVVSHKLRLVGECDVVEFHKSEDGVRIQGKDGHWLPYPIEYKHGKPKSGDEDRLQVCAEAICLEEMLCCQISYGYLFYQSVRRREKVELTSELKNKVKIAAEEMWQIQLRQYTPVVKPAKKCNTCSIKDYCLPQLAKKTSVHAYIQEHIRSYRNNEKAIKFTI